MDDDQLSDQTVGDRLLLFSQTFFVHDGNSRMAYGLRPAVGQRCSVIAANQPEQKQLEIARLTTKSHDHQTGFAEKLLNTRNNRCRKRSV